MIDVLITYLEQFHPLTQEEKLFVQENVPVKSLPKNEVLLEEGDVSNEFFFIIKGCIRMFYTVNGEEKTAFFYQEKDFVSAYESFTKEVPAKNSFQAIEDSTIAIVSKETAFLLLQTFPKFEFLARIAMEQELIVYQDVVATFITLTPEQRYLNIQENKPELLQRVPQYHLATYLGVSPETLSRIRKRIASK